MVAQRVAVYVFGASVCLLAQTSNELRPRGHEDTRAEEAAGLLSLYHSHSHTVQLIICNKTAYSNHDKIN